MILINRTPQEFPLVFNRDIQIPTYEDIHTKEIWLNFWYNSDTIDKRRFRLEIIPRLRGLLEQIVEVSIIVNGQTKPMLYGGNLYGSQYWYYDSPNDCNPYYTYQFKIKYKVGIWFPGIGFIGNTYTIHYPIPTKRVSLYPYFTVRVSQFGNVICYMSGHFILDSEITYEIPIIFYLWLYVQNLTKGKINLSATITQQAPNTFAIGYQPGMPPYPVLNCGDFVAVDVNYGGNGSSLDKAVLDLVATDANSNAIIRRFKFDLRGDVIAG